MLYVGLDIRTTHSTGCVLNGHGKLHERWTVPRCEPFVARLQRLSRFRAVFEASTGDGRFFALLCQAAERVAVALHEPELFAPGFDFAQQRVPLEGLPAIFQSQLPQPGGAVVDGCAIG